MFDGQTEGTVKLTIAPSLLQEGPNNIILVAQGGDMDISLVDYIRLTYWHTYTADSDALKFTASSGNKVSISGFSSQNIRADGHY